LLLFEADLNSAPKAVDGQWIDHGGVAGPLFRALGPQPTYAHHMGFDLTQRVGSGLFLNAGDWVAQVDSLATTLAPAPRWLQARPDTALHMVHGGTGYAVLPPITGSRSNCARTIEVVAPSGTSCGFATFNGVSPACSYVRTTVGYDGTVILVFDEAIDQCSSSGSCTCTWQWWPGFFR
jgi:hypothetical protein